ncbi:hypothetical protein D3C76_1640080 [compost metagenome]
MSSNEPHRLSTGKLLANIARRVPNIAMISRTIQALSMVRHARPAWPRPEILTCTFGHCANRAIAARHPAKPSALRSLGNPA